jgi:hypothetical protein
MSIPRLFTIGTFFAAIALLTGCGTSESHTSGPNGPTTSHHFQNPQLLWPGDSQVSTLQGDHGINDSLLYVPGVIAVSDGSGGAFLVWEADVQGQVWVQRMDATGHRVWPTEVSAAPNSPFRASPAAVSDGAGGVIVAWVDGRVGFCGLSFKGDCDIYAQRFDATGKALWQTDGIPVVTAPQNQGISGIAMASDGFGGAVLAWEDGRSCCTIFAQRVDSAGKQVWLTDGVQVSPPPTLVAGCICEPPQIVGDGTGGAIVSWWNNQVILREQAQTISVQKLDPTGKAVWGNSGVTVDMQVMSPAPDGERRYFRMVADGAGGVTFAANQNVSISIEERHVITQRISAAGQNLWSAGGVRVSSGAGAQAYPALIAVAGGAIIAWRNCTDLGFNNCDIAAQKMDLSGRLLWGPQGVPIVSIPNNQGSQAMAPNGTGGAFIVWSDCRNYPDVNACYVNMDIYGQEIDANGQVLWEPNGFPISNAKGNQGVPFSIEFTPTSYALVTDSQGGLILSWPDGRNNFCFAPNISSSCDLFAQRIKP